MIARMFFWMFPFLLLLFDMAFYDIFVLFPVFFFLEATREFDFEKAIRYVFYLGVYTIATFNSFRIENIIVIFLVILLDSFKENFLKVWVLSLLESVVFFGIRIFVYKDLVPIYSILFALLFNFYLLQKKIIKYR
ncbi:hypothetical protein SU69_06715 [Thermosipho melanesiensis]|uniref:Uncharacterized protein n=2 Tax=Thermosipho melanesiensis TaxID=46541 RepID=A6LMM4_THEM4|nr:hypothetical protein [Thermosipho melanesiensis]ABR31175.1 hypothetical protein Tmel_1326 [Thermosipho melanesiensis BI429]APT74264.1 hypothetical protein BW47_07040 [Thermosipho melanesiensis]OOC36203.1 hypothetical protein SU68_06785 [Thermosipho melanesiensis]OOC37021.1 hypothetical protein SU69_06715 [Thermosipho melanesiensis]OOC37773.1 hypothetical protein SU70_06725 [Thermosipho melanesiensis]